MECNQQLPSFQKQDLFKFNIMNQKMKNKGFTLPEVIFSIVILGTVLTYSLSVFFQILTENGNLTEYNNIQMHIQKKLVQINTLGFWIWEGDSDNTYLDEHPFSTWKTALSDDGYTGHSIMEVTFLKKQGPNYVAFSGDDFDNNEERVRVRVNLGLYTSKGGIVSENMTLIISKNQSKYAWAQLYAIKAALRMYAENNSGNYPPTSTWAADLVPTYIAEIPNNPYTKESNKVTHIEDVVDWSYTNSSNTVTLAAQSHLTTITDTF